MRLSHHGKRVGVQPLLAFFRISLLNMKDDLFYRGTGTLARITVVDDIIPCWIKEQLVVKPNPPISVVDYLRETRPLLYSMSSINRVCVRVVTLYRTQTHGNAFPITKLTSVGAVVECTTHCQDRAIN